MGGREEVRCWNKELRFLKIGIYLMRVKLFGNWEATEWLWYLGFIAQDCHLDVSGVWERSVAMIKCSWFESKVDYQASNMSRIKQLCYTQATTTSERQSIHALFLSMHETVKTIRRRNCCPLMLWNVVSTVILYLYDYGNTQSTVHCFQLGVLWRQQISIAEIKECCLQN